MVQDKKARPRYGGHRAPPTTIRQCRDCQSMEIKARTNYSHGKKSKSITMLTCKKCNSANIQVTKPRGRF